MTFARAAAAGRSRRARPSRAPAAHRSLIRWDRVARLMLLIVLALILASYVGPAASYIRAWHFAGQTRSELHQLQSENKALHKRLRQLHDPRRIEFESRRIGMARPDEKVYVVKGLPSGGASK